MAAVLSAAQIGMNLQAIFPGIQTEKYYGDWCKLGSFLTDPDLVIEAMAHLDEAMFTKLSGKRGNLPQNKAAMAPVYAAYYAAPVRDMTVLGKGDVSHVLAEVLTETELANDFKTEMGTTQRDILAAPPAGTPANATPAAGNPRVPTYHGFVQPAAFMLQLERQTHWKDPGAQMIHGEFTHRLQWYAAIRHAPCDKAAAKVFRAIGKFKTPYDRGGRQGPPNLYLWDALCDRTNAKDVSFDDHLFRTHDAGDRGLDFRSPENLNWYLMHEARDPHRWPLLKTFLIARYNKRRVQFELSEAFNANDPMFLFQADYLAKKLYGKTWATCDAPETDFINRVIGDGSDQIWKF